MQRGLNAFYANDDQLTYIYFKNNNNVNVLVSKI